MYMQNKEDRLPLQVSTKRFVEWKYKILPDQCASAVAESLDREITKS